MTIIVNFTLAAARALNTDPSLPSSEIFAVLSVLACQQIMTFTALKLIIISGFCRPILQFFRHQTRSEAPSGPGLCAFQSSSPESS